MAALSGQESHQRGGGGGGAEEEEEEEEEAIGAEQRASSSRWGCRGRAGTEQREELGGEGGCA